MPIRESILFVVLLFACSCSPDPAPPEGGDVADSPSPPAGPGFAGRSAATAATAAADVETFEISVDGMMCAINCPPQVRSALSSLPGVTGVVVDFQKKLATVRAERGRVESPQLLKALAATERFKGELLREH